MIDEFLKWEIEAGNIEQEAFKTGERKIKLHGHCQQKTVASTGQPNLYCHFLKITVLKKFLPVAVVWQVPLCMKKNITMFP